MGNNLLEKKDMLDAIVSAFKEVPGVMAAVLGGSYATGYANDESDLDIGLYYLEKNPFDIEKIRAITKHFSVQGSPLVTDFYEWGPWVNGGAWITTSVGKVDILYRNIDQVQQTITDAINGIWHHNFDQQPPYGFRSVIYLGETQVCKPLYDPHSIIQKLKGEILRYPVKLKQTILSDCLWLAEFTLTQCVQYANAADMYNTLGCFTRIVNYLINALFAINETYPLGDKRAVQIIKTFERSPLMIEETLNRVLGQAGIETQDLIANTALLKGLWDQIVDLTAGQYRARFNIGNKG